MVTALARLGGEIGRRDRQASRSSTFAGAMDGPACEKCRALRPALRRLQCCRLLVLCDTPGLMVGPDIEKTGLVRQPSARLLAALLRQFHHADHDGRAPQGLWSWATTSWARARSIPRSCSPWPTAEFGGMGLEGAASIIYRRELEGMEDAEVRASRHRDAH